MTRKKMTNAILDANGGLDSARALNTARNILTNNDLKQPVLFHLVLTGSQSIATYQAVIKSLVRRLRSRCRTEYFGAYEVEPQEGKGLHAHCFFVIETSKKTPFKILDVNDGEYLHKLAERHKLVNQDGSVRRIHVSKPKNRMHGGHFFARPVGELLVNCLEWIEYEFKLRSKDGVPSRETYFNSEFKANTIKHAAVKAKRMGYITPSAALPAEQEASISLSGEKVIPDKTICKSEAAARTDYKPLQGDSNHSSWVGIELKPEPHQGAINASQAHNNDKGSDLKLTPAQAYLCRLYETCVDADMDVEAIRLYLLEQGIRKTPAMIVDDLEHTFGFLGYAASHPAPAKPDTARIDAMIGREHDNGNRRFGRHDAVNSSPPKLNRGIFPRAS